MKKSKELFITNVNSSKMKSTNETSVASYIIPKKKINPLSKEKLAENFFDYLVNENINYGNLEKVTEYYENKIARFKSTYDLNIETIKIKKEEIKNLKISIFNIIINQITLENKDMDLYYEKMKEKIKNEINLIQHELEVYKNFYSDIYKENYLLNSKLDEMRNSARTYDQQYDKYVIIKEAAFSKLKKQEEILNSLTFYFVRNQYYNKHLLSKRQNKLKQLNYEIHVIKSDETKNEEHLRILAQKNNEFDNYLNKRKSEYMIYLNELKSYQYNYIKDIFNLSEFYKNTKEQDIDKAINIYNKIKFKKMELSNMISLKTKKIIKLNTIITNMKNEYNFILKSIKNKAKEEHEQSNQNMDCDDYINEINFLIDKNKGLILEKRKMFFDYFRILITAIKCALKHIVNINHSRNVAVSTYENIPIEKRDEIIKKYQHYFDNNFTHKKRVNFEANFTTPKFLKFIVFIIKELNFQIKSAVSNIYQILQKKYIEKEKEMKRRQALEEIDIFNIIQKPSHQKSQEVEQLKILEYDTNEYQTLYEEELKIKQKKLEERQKFFELQEKELLKKKSNNKKRYIEDYFNIDQKNKQSLPTLDYLINNRSADTISTKEFVEQYYQYFNKNLPDNENIYSSRNRKINIRKFDFIINYANDLVSKKKAYEDTKFEKYQKILVKSKKIKDEIQKREIDKYLKKNKKMKKKLRDQYRQDISTDSEKDEKEKKDELALQLVTKELEELKKRKKYALFNNDKEVSQIFERFNDLRTLDLNFIKNKGNYLIDSGIINEYMFKLQKQFKDHKSKSQNLRIRIQKRAEMESIPNQNKKNKNNYFSNSSKSYKSFVYERYNSNKNQSVGTKRIWLKKLNNSVYKNHSVHFKYDS